MVAAWMTIAQVPPLGEAAVQETTGPRVRRA